MHLGVRNWMEVKLDNCNYLYMGSIFYKRSSLETKKCLVRMQHICHCNLLQYSSKLDHHESSWWSFANLLSTPKKIKQVLEGNFHEQSVLVTTWLEGMSQTALFKYHWTSLLWWWPWPPWCCHAVAHDPQIDHHLRAQTIRGHDRTGCRPFA